MFDTKQGGFVMIWSAANRPQKKFGAQESFVCMKISISRRIAVQIWNQRRQEDAARARALKATTEDAARRRDAGSGLKGLKGGFLGKVIDSKPSSSRQFASTQPAFKPMTWPENHPRERAIQEYEFIKAGFLNQDQDKGEL